MNPNGKALLKENKRYYLLDSLRGISTVSMVAFHLCYDIFMMYGLNKLVLLSHDSGLGTQYLRNVHTAFGNVP